MNRALSINLLLLLFAATCYAIPISDPTNLHNLSSSATHGGPKALSAGSGGTDEICVFCHTPHAGAPDTPLWSRPDPDTMGAFPLYAQPLAIKLDIGRTGYDASSPNYPNGASRMCLSCHDGATAIGVLLGNQSITMDGAATITDVTDIIDLSTSHPISFKYNNDVIVNVLNPVDFQLPGTLSSDPDVPLVAGQMQCTTCHDPHEDSRAITSYPFWRNDKTSVVSYYDDVCNACHIAAPAGTPPIHSLP